MHQDVLMGPSSPFISILYHFSSCRKIIGRTLLHSHSSQRHESIDHCGSENASLEPKIIRVASWRNSSGDVTPVDIEADSDTQGAENSVRNNNGTVPAATTIRLDELTQLVAHRTHAAHKCCNCGLQGLSAYLLEPMLWHSSGSQRVNATTACPPTPLPPAEFGVIGGYWWLKSGAGEKGSKQQQCPPLGLQSNAAAPATDPMSHHPITRDRLSPHEKLLGCNLVNPLS